MSGEVRRAPGWRVFGVHVEYRHICLVERYSHRRSGTPKTVILRTFL